MEIKNDSKVLSFGLAGLSALLFIFYFDGVALNSLGFGQFSENFSLGVNNFFGTFSLLFICFGFFMSFLFIQNIKLLSKIFFMSGYLLLALMLPPLFEYINFGSLEGGYYGIKLAALFSKNHVFVTFLMFLFWFAASLFFILFHFKEFIAASVLKIANGSFEYTDRRRKKQYKPSSEKKYTFSGKTDKRPTLNTKGDNVKSHKKSFGEFNTAAVKRQKTVPWVSKITYNGYNRIEEAMFSREKIAIKKFKLKEESATVEEYEEIDTLSGETGEHAPNRIYEEINNNKNEYFNKVRDTWPDGWKNRINGVSIDTMTSIPLEYKPVNDNLHILNEHTFQGYDKFKSDDIVDLEYVVDESKKSSLENEDFSGSIGDNDFDENQFHEKEDFPDKNKCNDDIEYNSFESASYDEMADTNQMYGENYVYHDDNLHDFENQGSSKNNINTNLDNPGTNDYYEEDEDSTCDNEVWVKGTDDYDEEVIEEYYDEDPVSDPFDGNKKMYDINLPKITLPNTNMLINDYVKNSSKSGEVTDDDIEDASTLENTLLEFGIKAEVSDIIHGPVVTMFKLIPAPGVKLSKIENLSDNLALRLAAKSIRIIAPIPGESVVGIEVPNKKRELVSFKEVVQSKEFENEKLNIPIGIGKDIYGNIVTIDLHKMPHVLVAGATGAGKSVCVNAFLASILFSMTPDDLKLLLIDPKIVELQPYNDIPHLLTPVITEPKEAVTGLKYLVYEMEERYALLGKIGVRDIVEYNKLVESGKINFSKMPFIVAFVDEFADLMSTSGKEAEMLFARLTAKARAIGIHLVLATQRPSTDVITGLIKANVPARISFQVISYQDSRIILDQKGAEKLLGQGDMLYLSPTQPFPIRLQGAFLNKEEVDLVVDHWKSISEPDYIDIDEVIGESSSISEVDIESRKEDPLFSEAVDIVFQSQKGSASYLQRRLNIGYNRAARLIEEMEEMGIVGPANGSKPREVIGEL